MALWDIYFVSKFIPKVLNKVSFNFFYEDNNFLSLRLIELAFLLIFDAVSKVVITAPSQIKIVWVKFWDTRKPRIISRSGTKHVASNKMLGEIFPTSIQENTGNLVYWMS